MARQVFPLIVAPWREAAFDSTALALVEPVQAHARLAVEVDVRRELSAVDFALHAPGLVTQRLLASAWNIRHFGRTRHVALETADVPKAHPGADGFTDEQLVEKDSDWRIRRTGNASVTTAGNVLLNAGNADYG